ncbi:MAG: hypothetical protein HY672_03155 [Chloroflexi bacterium]|nr:hypothetical protein [Chloroflexota bacterium]
MTTKPVQALQTLIQDDLPPAPGANGHHSPGAIGEEVEHYTDMRLAQRIVARYGTDIRYCHPWGKFLIWDRVRYASDDQGRIMALAKDTVLSLYQEALAAYAASTEAAAKGDKTAQAKHHQHGDALFKWAEKSEATARLEAAITLVKSEPGIPVVPSQLDADPWVLNVLNGIVDLRTGSLIPHDRARLITKLAPVAYDPHATLELWDRFLSEALPDEDTRAYVQRCVGATIVGKADDDLLLVCHGQGGTGKGTFLNAIQRALGDYAAAADLSTFSTFRTARDAHGPQPDLARLQGKRMVAISEVDTGGTVALLKRATGGDPIVTRSHHQESFEFIPQFTLWIIANERLRVPDNDSGIWRRLREVPFRTVFAKPDLHIRPTLATPSIAGPAVLAWAVAGCLAWQQGGLGNLPQQVVEATADYQADMNPLAEWIEDKGLEITGWWTPFKALWDSYSAWAKDSRVKYPLGRKTFAQRLQARFQEERRSHDGGRGYHGLALILGTGDISEMSRKATLPIEFQIQSSYRENIEVNVPKCPPVANSYLAPNVPADTTPNVPENHEMSPSELPVCPTCGKDDFRYTEAGDEVCAWCNPDTNDVETF